MQQDAAAGESEGCREYLRVVADLKALRKEKKRMLKHAFYAALVERAEEVTSSAVLFYEEVQFRTTLREIIDLKRKRSDEDVYLDVYSPEIYRALENLLFTAFVLGPSPYIRREYAETQTGQVRKASLVRLKGLEEREKELAAQKQHLEAGMHPVLESLRRKVDAMFGSKKTLEEGVRALDGTDTADNTEAQLLRHFIHSKLYRMVPECIIINVSQNVLTMTVDDRHALYNTYSIDKLRGIREIVTIDYEGGPSLGTEGIWDYFHIAMQWDVRTFTVYGRSRIMRM